MVSKNLLKKTAQVALKSKYGFAPALSAIRLLEASDDRTYILFAVDACEYRFSSHKFSDGSIWCGQGTIEKLS